MSQISLTEPQAAMLVYVRYIGREGYDAPRKHPVLAALERRKLVRFGGTRALPRIEAWHITPDGAEWLKARAAADAAMVL
jgi:hypothetical protein